MPVSLHILTPARRGERRFHYTDFGAGFYMAIPHEMQLTLTDIIVRGVLERYPRLNIVLAEGDVGWLGHFLERLDRAHVRYEHQNGIHLNLKPSEYFERQVFGTFIKRSRWRSQSRNCWSEQSHVVFGLSAGNRDSKRCSPPEPRSCGSEEPLKNVDTFAEIGESA